MNDTKHLDEVLSGSDLGGRPAKFAEKTVHGVLSRAIRFYFLFQAADVLRQQGVRSGLGVGRRIEIFVHAG